MLVIGWISSSQEKKVRDVKVFLLPLLSFTLLSALCLLHFSSLLFSISPLTHFSLISLYLSYPDANTKTEIEAQLTSGKMTVNGRLAEVKPLHKHNQHTQHYLTIHI